MGSSHFANLNAVESVVAPPLGGGGGGGFNAGPSLANSSGDIGGGDGSDSGACARHGLASCFLCSLSTAPMNAGLSVGYAAGNAAAAVNSEGADGPRSVASLSSGFGRDGPRSGGGKHSAGYDPPSAESSEADEEEYRRVSIAEAERRGEFNQYAEETKPSPYHSVPPASTAGMRRSSDGAQQLLGSAPGSALSWSLERPGPTSVQNGDGSGGGARPSAQDALRAAHSILTSQVPS